MRLHNNDERLTHEESTAFTDALCDAFSNIQDFNNLFQRLTGRWLEDLGITGDRDTVFIRAVQYIEDNSQTKELLVKALLKRPGNGQLSNLATKFALRPPWEQYLPSPEYLHPETPPLSSQPDSHGPSLERTIRDLDSDVDVAQWRKRLEQLEGQVCLIEVQTGQELFYGTGFLLGPDIVMTNYHIVEEVIDGSRSHHKVKIYFDYKLDEHGKIQSIGKIHELAEDWHIDHSENSDLDLKKHEAIIDVEAHKLDYALLRLKDSPGTAVLGNDQQIMRGWMELPTEKYDFKTNEPLFILHHPGGDRLKLAMNTHSVKSINTNGTRLWYLTGTRHGSSGAPCFTVRWQLVAIHQSGDPDYQKEHGDYNQGIPLSTIYDFLKKRGKTSLLGKPTSIHIPEQSGNEVASAAPEAITLLPKLVPPEGSMNQQLQNLLFSKLNQPALKQALDKQQSIEIDETELKIITSHLSSKELLLLGQAYIQVARSEVTIARKPFDGDGDLRIHHYTDAIEVLDNTINYLRKLCILINAYDTLPYPTNSVYSSITVHAERITSDIQNYRQDMDRNKNKHLGIAKRIEIRNTFEYLSGNLERIIKFIDTK